MTLIGFIGELGTGKTLALTYFAYKNYLNKNDIFSNYTLNFPHKKILSADDILEVRNGFMAMDELWQWADSRMSSSKKNKFISLVLAKSRKRNISIGYTAQYFKSIDIRIRNISDYLVMPQLNKNESRCICPIYTNHNFRLVKTLKFNTFPIFRLYDTNEEVEEFEYNTDKDIKSIFKKLKE